MYLHTSSIKCLFKHVSKVQSIDDFWRFMEHDFLEGVYPEEWYNAGSSDSLLCPDQKKQNGEYTKKLKNPLIKLMYSLYMGHIDKYIIGAPCKIDPKDRMVLHSNKLLGAPRLRLLRVRNDSCVIPKSFQDTIQVMFFMMFES